MTTHLCVFPSELFSVSEESVTQPTKPPLDFLRLPHPRTGLPTLFLPTECLPQTTETTQTGILEVQAVCPPDQRSWILNEEIMADGKLLVMTPIDPVFLVIPLIHVPQSADCTSTQFRTRDDIFEAAVSKFVDNPEASTEILRGDIIQFCSLECTRKALANLCEVKEISTDIVVYRYSSTKLIEYLQAKVARLGSSSAFDTSRTLTRNLAKDGLMDDGQESLLKVGRIRACCELISQYLPPEIRDILVNCYDFTALHEYIELQKQEAISKMAVPESKAGKGKPVEKEATKTNKKRKAVKASHGVENLKKANTNGMAKISSFFNKS